MIKDAFRNVVGGF